MARTDQSESSIWSRGVSEGQWEAADGDDDPDNADDGAFGTVKMGKCTTVQQIVHHDNPHTSDEW